MLDAIPRLTVLAQRQHKISKENLTVLSKSSPSPGTRFIPRR